MERREYLKRLDRALRALTGSRERLEILAYYREYLEEAGSEREAEAMAALGRPEELARQSVEAAPEAPPPGRRRIPRSAPAEGETYRCPAALVGLCFDGIRVDVDGARVCLEAGEAFLVRLDGGAVACAVRNGVLQAAGGGEAGALVSITVPRGVRLEEVRLRTRGGDVLVGAVEIGRLSVDAGAGAVELRGTRAGALDLRSDTGISAPGSRVPQRLRGRGPRRRRTKNRREYVPMRTNVFLRSTRRQPVRALCLALVTALMTFAFVARASEYLLISQEIDRLSGYYRSIGVLDAAKRSAREDTSAAAEYLENSPYVKQVERYRYVPALLQNDVLNGDTDGAYSDRDFYFYGTLEKIVPAEPGNGAALPKIGELHFSVDTVLSGYPENIGESVNLLMDAKIQKNLADLEPGMRCLMRGTFEVETYSFETSTGTLFYYDWRGFFAAPLGGNNLDGYVWYQEAPSGEADLADPRLAGLEEAIRTARESQQVLTLLPTRDMSALPETQASSPSIYLSEGRWLDGADEAAGSRVCVVNATFAAMRGLQVGDTLPLELRDAPSSFGYLDGEPLETAEETYEIVGLYEYISEFRATAVRNTVYVPASTIPDSFVHGAEYSHRQWWTNQSLGVENGGRLPLAGQIFFILNDPDAEAPFLAESGEALKALGYEVQMLPVNWKEFQAAVKPMIRSSSFNLAVYTGVLLTALCLVAFVYFRSRRREMAITRSLGLPVGRCVREASLPLLLIGLIGVLPGWLLGWRNTVRTAAETLESLASLAPQEGAMAALNPLWLAALLVLVLVLFAALTVGAARFRATRPVLAQVQGTGTQKTKRRDRREAASAAAVQVSQLSFEAVHTIAAAPRVNAPAMNPKQVLRFVWRHIVRSPAKSVLAMVLAAGFTVGLAAVQLSIATGEARLEELFLETRVDFELTQTSGTETTGNLGFLIHRKTVDDLLATGAVVDPYLEGRMSGTLYTDRTAWENPDDPSALWSGLQNKAPACTLYGIEDAARFLSDLGSGNQMEITYHEGWDASLFARDWSAQAGQDGEPVVPVIIPRKWTRSFAGQMEEDPDRKVYKAGDTVAVECGGKIQVCVVAGVYSSQTAARSEAVLIPLSLMKEIGGRQLYYGRARFTVDPAQNRDLEAVRPELEAIACRLGAANAPVAMTMWDEELKQAVEPLEDSIALMKLLYPVVVVLSVLVAAGVSVLFVMLSAKEAAILRIQGTTRARTIVMLMLQQVFTCFAGLTVGLAGVLLYTGTLQPELLRAIGPGAVICAALYLAAGVAGAAVSSGAVTRKNPLEMLQVRE